MKIWIIDHYAVPPKYYPLARQTIFAKKLIERGHDVRIFAASSVHNSSINLIEDGSLYKEDVVDGVPYVYIKARSYKGNGLSRLINMEEFARKLPKVLKHYEKPDAVLSCSMTLQACRQGIIAAKKYGAKAVAQVTDLWPETLIAYGKCGSHHPYVLYLRRIEKWVYSHCDSLIFSMEGAYDYIVERKWNRIISCKKVILINNGVDLEKFKYNKANYIIEDFDLDSIDTFKVIYTGSIRQVNKLGLILDAAKEIRDERVKVLIWGAGDELPYLQKRVADENISNVIFKGRVEKRYIPYITSKADLNLMHGDSAPILRFGISPNKLFDYFAAGKPIITTFKCSYNPAVEMGAGTMASDNSARSIASEIEKYANMDESEYTYYCTKAALAAEKYDFEKLTDKLENTLLK